VRSQEQAFRAYYASMTDPELLEVAANRVSFIAIAQKVVADELRKRGLNPLPPPVPTMHHSVIWNWGHHVLELLHHPHPPVPT
jgi:hypothetical protein